MATAILDWRNIADEKEKYQAYLCSPEWGRLRAAVHERAGGVCERCKIWPIDAVHHVTYARKYHEELEDLAGECKWCHEFTHGKGKWDFEFHKGEHWSAGRYLADCIAKGKAAFDGTMECAAGVDSDDCLARAAIRTLRAFSDGMRYALLLDAIEIAAGVIESALPYLYTWTPGREFPPCSYFTFRELAGVLGVSLLPTRGE